MRYAIRAHGRYPCVFTDYRDLIDHPKERTDAYRQEATRGSTLVPLLGAWLAALGDEDALRVLSDIKSNELKLCTLQLWLPDESSEDQLYVGRREHGVSLCDLPLSPSGRDLLEAIAEGCSANSSFDELSANRANYWPLVLMACRHYRLPVPPQFWINNLVPPEQSS
jgi:hypothetical protein